MQVLGDPFGLALAEARTYIAALTDLAVSLEASLAYERILLFLDSIHGDDVPALDSSGLIEDRTALYVVAKSAIEELVDHGADALQVELVLAMLEKPANSTPRCEPAMYGQNSGALRAELSTLLRQHRIQQRIGGAGMHTVPVTTTPAEREEIGRLIQRYRYGLLTWCRQALDAAGASRTDARGGPGAPEVDLRRRLIRSMEVSMAGPPSMEDLTTPQEFPLEDAWRLAARAGVLGEHDFAGELAHGRLDVDQRLTVIKDAAEIIRGLLVLDRRYSNIPGWDALSGAVRLQRAAEACAFIEAADYTVDRRGWRPPARTIDGPPRAGIAGVIQAEHNVLIHLNRFPSALNYRRLLDSQRELSSLLANRVASTAPELTVSWGQRASTYADLHREARNLGGRVGMAAPRWPKPPTPSPGCGGCRATAS